MASVKLESKVQIEIKDIIESISQLETAELEDFVNQLTNLLARRKAPHLPEKEAALLLNISQWLPPDIKQRYYILTERRRNFELTESEHKELLELVELVEVQHAARMKHMIDLAKMRQVPLEQLMEELGIMPSVYA